MKKSAIVLPPIVDKQYLGNKGFVLYGPFINDIRVEVGVAMPDDMVQEFVQNSIDYSISVEYGIKYIFVKRRKQHVTKERI